MQVYVIKFLGFVRQRNNKKNQQKFNKNNVQKLIGMQILLLSKCLVGGNR